MSNETDRRLVAAEGKLAQLQDLAAEWLCSPKPAAFTLGMRVREIAGQRANECPCESYPINDLLHGADPGDSCGCGHPLALHPVKCVARVAS